MSTVPIGIVRRIVEHPVKTIAPVMMRRLGIQRQVQVQLSGGRVFRGVLPEAVTTSVWRKGVHDEDTTMMLRGLLDEGDTFVDVGAHFGYFSLLAADLVGTSGRVICLEPMPEAFAYLKRNTAGLGGEVVLHNSAAWDRRVTLDFADAGVVNSSLNSAFAFRERTLTRVDPVQVEVQACPLDEVLADIGPVHGIKVDAESAELNVLRGAASVLKAHRPWVVVELGDLNADERVTTHPPASEQIQRLMTDLGYRAHTVTGGRVLPADLRSPVRYLNVLYRPH